MLTGGYKTRQDMVFVAEQKTSYSAKPYKLFNRLRKALRYRHYNRRAEQIYCYWVKRFIFLHKDSHPVELAELEINTFFTHFAVKAKVSTSTHNKALYTLLSLYRHVLDCEIGNLAEVRRTRKHKLVPIFMSRDVVRVTLTQLSGAKRLMALFNIWSRFVPYRMPAIEDSGYLFYPQRTRGSRICLD